MADELKIVTPSVLETKVPVQTLQQTGEKNIFATHVSNMNITVQANIPPQVLQPSKMISVNADTTYYNLFVSPGIDFSSNSAFLLDTDRVLTGYMEDYLKKEFSELNDMTITRIKAFPSIFANENNSYGHTDEQQMLGFGFVQQIKVRHDGVKIYPNIQYLLPQQRFNENLFEFDIRGNNSFNEFNRTHWSIKKVDLVAELRELGFCI